MVVITVVSFCLLLSGAYRSLNVLSHHFNLNSILHNKGRVMVLCVNIAFRATNTIRQQISDKQTINNPCGVYRLKCNTCNKVYVGQSGRAITQRYKERIRYIKSNNPVSAHATHILQNIHEFGPEKDTMQLVKKCQKSSHMDCWEALYMYAYRKQHILIDEQQVNDTNDIFDLATIHPLHDAAI